MTEQEQKPAQRARSGRSPSYPGIPLEQAIKRAKIIYGHEKRNKAPVSVMMSHWGYANPTSGRASVTFAALKKFGLVADEGSGINRPAWLTDLAFEILHAPLDDKRAAIRRSALMPPIHRELWEQYGADLPSDHSLKWTLMDQRGFTPTGADEFIREFRETIAYAGLGETATDPEPAQDEEWDDENSQPNRDDTRRQGMSDETLTIPVPIIGGTPVTVAGRFPITEAAWTQFMAVLEAMKPGLVASESSNAAE